jgi:diaminopimelate epimerase
VRYAKVEALGNDFVLLEARVLGRGDPAPWARSLCRRERGIGADGLLVVRGRGRRLGLRVFNADGSEAELSGNGARCVGAYAFLRRWWKRGGVLETRAGELRVTLRTRGRILLAATVVLPAPRFRAPRDLPRVRVEGHLRTPLALEVGNPHAVLFVGRIDPAAHALVGRALERHRAFRSGTNVEFVRIRSRSRLSAWLWERGVGVTQASGSGAAAAFAAARVLGRVGPRAIVEMAGGRLGLAEVEGGIAVTGAARVLCEGKWLAGPIRARGVPRRRASAAAAPARAGAAGVSGRRPAARRPSRRPR